MRGILIQTAEETPVRAWMLQGTIYDTFRQARSAALKLLCANTGVIIKKHGAKYTLLFWRAA